MTDSPKPFFLQALDALKRGDRRGAAALLDQELRFGNTSAKNLPSVAQLAEHIGEIELAIEATRRAVVPGSLASLMAHWAMLAAHGRADEALAGIERQPAAIRDDPSVLHFRGTAAVQFGRADDALELFRLALGKAPAAIPTWFTLAMNKTFAPGDPDIAAMERVERSVGGAGDARAPLYYALGKAAEDCGDSDRAFEHYQKGAGLLRGQRTLDMANYAARAERTIRTFTRDAFRKLKPSGATGQRSLFVTGLPRSGTTLTEQILLGHSAIGEGAEVNLFSPALTPVLGGEMAGAVAYQERSEHADPWGEIGRDYCRLIDMRFSEPGLVVDKSLGQALIVGLMLHALPEARVAWLRRSPEDVALSCFRTFFSAGLPWTCSLTDIADYMRADDLLQRHWLELFPDRIMVVPYEELVRAPADWGERLQRHFGLPVEAGLETRSREGRAIGTASVGQVRQAISTSRIGRAAGFERHLKPFRDRYYR